MATVRKVAIFMGLGPIALVEICTHPNGSALTARLHWWRFRGEVRFRRRWEKAAWPALPGSTPRLLPVFSPQRFPPEISMRTLLTNATLIDCVHPQPIQGTKVLIEDGRILDKRKAAYEIRVGDALEIDLQGGYLMPGLWDAH